LTSILKRITMCTILSLLTPIGARLMDTETVRLNITIPKDLLAALNEHTGPRKKSQFIARAIHEQIQKDRKAKLDAALIEGYQASKNESLALSHEFEAADLEGWNDY